MASNDLVIIIPGITGSSLSRGGQTVWSSAPSGILRAIATLGRDVRGLELPADIGDDAPSDGVRAEALMPSFHVIPGLWSPILGYETLVKRIAAVCNPEEGKAVVGIPNPVTFPYDWRLSNRYNARQLKKFIEPTLERWREAAPQNRDAKFVFVCHSMGGLIARWYISKEGGASLTRKLITLGTPYRGAVKALSVLEAGPAPVLKGFGEDLHRAVLSFPAVHQLLPTYACISRGPEQGYLIDEPVVPISRAALCDAFAFYQDLENSESSDLDNSSRRHALVGIGQPTLTAASITGGAYNFSETLGDQRLGGDGTVSSASSTPRNVALDDNSIRRILEKHGALQCNHAVLDEVESVLTSEPIIVKGIGATDISVSAPELLGDNERFSAVITSRESRSSVAVTLRDERGRDVERIERPLRKGELVYATGSLPPGAYTLEVHDNAVAGTDDAVRSAFLVWPAEHDIA